MTAGPSIIAWMDFDQADLVRRLVQCLGDRLGADLAGVGTPDARRGGELSQAMGATVHDDLRELLASATCDIVLLASPGGLGEEVLQADLHALLDAKSRGVRVVTLSPLPASAMDLHAGGWLRSRQGVTPSECVRFVPLARSGRGFVALRERLQDFGRISSMSIEVMSRPSVGSLGGHLFCAMQLAHALMGEIESVDAAYHPPGPVGTLRPLPGDTLRDLRGGLTAHLRTTDGRGITLLASDRASSWSRDLTILGDGGQMRVSDDSLEWIGVDGEPVDSLTPSVGDVPRLSDGGVRVIADAIEGVLGDHPAEAQPVDVGSVLALAQAALLSTKTGQSESPETIQRMVRAG